MSYRKKVKLPHPTDHKLSSLIITVSDYTMVFLQSTCMKCFPQLPTPDSREFSYDGGSLESCLSCKQSSICTSTPAASSSMEPSALKGVTASTIMASTDKKEVPPASPKAPATNDSSSFMLPVKVCKRKGTQALLPFPTSNRFTIMGLGESRILEILAIVNQASKARKASNTKLPKSNYVPRSSKVSWNFKIEGGLGREKQYL